MSSLVTVVLWRAYTYACTCTLGCGLHAKKHVCTACVYQVTLSCIKLSFSCSFQVIIYFLPISALRVRTYTSALHDN